MFKKHYLLWVFIFSIFCRDVLAENSEEVIFENFWKPSVKLDINGTSKWKIIKDSVCGLDAFNICKQNDTSICLNIESNDKLENSKISNSWKSALWSFTSTGNDTVNIKNMWKSSIYIHIENGFIEAGEIQAGWFSARWKKIPSVSNKIVYESFSNRMYSLTPHYGDNIAFLLDDGNYDNNYIQEIVSTLDKAYEKYNLATGKKPSLLKHVNGLLSIAVVDDDDSCGAGCGYLGLTGIEIRKSYFLSLYDNVKKNNKYDQILFYELGRNFWFYESRIDRSEDLPQSGGAITTGYAVFMRLWIMEVLNLQGVFNGVDINTLKIKIKNSLSLYLSNSLNNFSNTIAKNKSGVSEISAPDLFASFLFFLQNKYGDKFIEALWKEVGKRPVASSNLKSTDNFIIAASFAAGKDLRKLFVNHWRWPELDVNGNKELNHLFNNGSNNAFIPIMLKLILEGS